jgi:hypothetical protein
MRERSAASFSSGPLEDDRADGRGLDVQVIRLVRCEIRTVE